MQAHQARMEFMRLICIFPLHLLRTDSEIGEVISLGICVVDDDLTLYLRLQVVRTRPSGDWLETCF